MIKIIKFDYHLHTNFSQDGKAEMEDVVLQAINLGLSEIALTDHYDFIYPNTPFPYQINYDNYYKYFSRIKNKYSGKINIIFGIELGISPHPKLRELITRFVNKYRFDFTIGSIHDVEGEDLYSGDFFKYMDKHTAYRYYLSYLRDSIKSVKEICVVGHLDFITRYGNYSDPYLKYDDFKDVIDEILIYLVKSGKGLEINTSGYRYGIGSVYPSLDILKRYHQLGGKIITVGSDAHRVGDIAKDFDKAQIFLKQAGFEHISVFRGLKPSFVRID